MEYRKLCTIDERECFIQSWEAAFSRKLDVSVYNWIFNKKNDLYAIIDGEIIVAGYCLLRNEAYYFGDVVNAALCNNVFVLPGYQGKNVFVNLGKYALKQAEELQIKIVIGIPNLNALPGHKRVGWTVLNNINFLEKIPGKCDFAKTVDSHIIEINTKNYYIYSEKIDQFSKKVIQGRTFSFIKSSNYFKWRYLERPESSYRIFVFLSNNNILGYIIFKYYKQNNRLHIIDLEAMNKEVLHNLLSIADCFTEKYSLINIWGSSIYAKEITEAGFSVSDEYSNLIAIYPYKNERVSLGSSFNIVLGDNDVF